MKLSRNALIAHAFCACLVAILVSGCTTPIGANRVPARIGYAQVEQNALSAGETSADSRWVIHRYGLTTLAKERPDEAVQQLHARGLAKRGREVLYALAELSYVAGDHVKQSVVPWEPRDHRDYYLAAAVYAYLFLFSDDAVGDKPSAYDRRFRSACDLYSHGLGQAFKERRTTDHSVEFVSGKRRLPAGEIDIEFDTSRFPFDMKLLSKLLLADEFEVHGLSTRVREPGIGTPLLGVSTTFENLKLARTVPATAFLRLESSLDAVAKGESKARLELHSIFDRANVKVGDAEVPLEADLTAPRAYTLNQSFAWRAERLQFLNPGGVLKSQMIQSTPYKPGLIPIVFVHGTFSSPVWWAEMFNTLLADPVVRSKYQIWMFLYSSSNPILFSAAELRQSITNVVQKLDPEGKDPALRQMVVIGHSQGGLLTKLTATETGDLLWNAVTTKSIDDLKATPEEKQFVRDSFYLKPLPEVKRVVFISTPHRGSYMAGNFVRNLVRRLVSTPSWVLRQGRSLASLKEQIDLPAELKHGRLTSIDSMSPRSPTLRALAEIPVATNVVAHSIIPVKPMFAQVVTGNDGVVEYKSAHVDYVESELIVRWAHSCQYQPESIEEVRRILHEHLKANQTSK